MTLEAVKGRVLPLPKTFTSARHLQEGQIPLLDNEDNEIDMACLVCEKAPSNELNHLTFVDIFGVVLIEK